MRRRLWVSVALTVVLVMSALLLAACDPQVTLGDIFVSYTSEGEITRAELQFTLPLCPSAGRCSRTARRIIPRCTPIPT